MCDNKFDETLTIFANDSVLRYEVPAVSISTCRDNSISSAAAGILSLSTDLKADTNSVFQIGSITKVMTTCLVMQLLDEGRLDLDKPVKYYLHDFIISDIQASEEITIRQLLNHTSGMAGDFFFDDPHYQGNPIARYVEHCYLLPLVSPPGTLYSYSNSAFVVAGRLVEVIRGISWYQAMEEYIFNPLGMSHALADPKDLSRYCAAKGHVWNGDAWQLSPEPWLSLGMAPCGSTPTMSARDLILFAQGHLNDGKMNCRKAWLSKSSLLAMRQHEIALPRTYTNINRYSGLGWNLREYQPEGRLIYGHVGATNGFCSSLQICPDKNAAFVILINGFALDVLESIQNELIEEVFGIDPTDRSSIDRLVSLTPRDKLIIGRYESMDKAIVIMQEGSELIAHLEYKNDPLPSEVLHIYRIKDQFFACETLDGTHRFNWAFVMGDGAECTPVYLFDGSRLNRRC